MNYNIYYKMNTIKDDFTFFLPKLILDQYF